MTTKRLCNRSSRNLQSIDNRGSFFQILKVSWCVACVAKPATYRAPEESNERATSPRMESFSLNRQRDDFLNIFNDRQGRTLKKKLDKLTAVAVLADAFSSSRL